MNEKIKKTEACSIDALWTCVEVGKLLTSTLNINRILSLIVEKMSQFIDADNWSLLLLDKEEQLCFEIVVGDGQDKMKGVRLEKGQGVAGAVALSGKALLIPDVTKDPRFNPQIDSETGFITKSIICLPLKIGNRIIGVMEVVNIREMESFDSSHLSLLTILTDYAAIAIDKARYVESVELMTLTDEYTGLYNARYLHKAIGDILDDVGKKDSELGVVFVDIDNFKEIVDTFGHLSGSQVLKEIGHVISGVLEKDDILIKYGGDEYVIIMPHKSRDQAALMCTKILKEMRQACFLAHESDSPKITASFGIAMYPEDARNKEDLLALADKRMYRIKQTTKSGVSAN